MSLEGLQRKRYLASARKPFDPVGLIVSTVTMALVILIAASSGGLKGFFDARSLLVVLGGTFASLVFQFDLTTFILSLKLIWKSFRGSPDAYLKSVFRELDRAIMEDSSILELREGEKIDGDMLNDVIYMLRRGLVMEEIDAFITARVQDEFLQRDTAGTLLQRGSVIAPAFGLFGTVIGLVGVMRALSTPGQLGPAMALALMTTAYGAALGSVFFTPLAGRLEHHNQLFVEAHRQLLSKIAVLVAREERRAEMAVTVPQEVAA